MFIYLQRIIILMCAPLFIYASTLKLACNNFPPLKIENSKKDFPGSDIEVLRESFKTSSINIETTFFPWKRALEMGQTGEMDGLCSCSYVKDRIEFFHYSDEIGKLSVGIYTKDNSKINKLNDLKGKKVGVIRGYHLEDELLKHKIEFVTASTDLILFKMLNADRIDAAYSFQATFIEFKKNNDFALNFKFHEIKSSPYFTCISKKLKNSEDYLAKFNIGLKAIKANGTYQKILNKYQLTQ